MSRVIDLAALPTDSGIVFPEGTSLNIDSNTLYIDSANNRIGIGTASPSRALHLSFTGSNGIRLQATDAGLPRIDFDDTAGSANIIGTANRLQIYTNNAERMRIDSSGNVSIGTSSFSNLGAINTPSAALFSSSGARLGLWGNGGRWWYLEGESANQFGIGFRGASNTTDYNVITLNTSGNVGIGTSSPSEKLRVVGTSGSPQFGAGTSSNSLFINAFDSGSIYMTASAINSTSFGFGAASNIPLFFMTNNTERMRITSGGNVGIGTSSPATTLTVTGSYANGLEIYKNGVDSNSSARLFFNSDTNTTALYNAGGNFIISTGATVGSSSGTERMRITSTGLVGIGTNNPSYTLDITSAISSVARFTTGSVSSVMYNSTGSGTSYWGDPTVANSFAVNAGSNYVSAWTNNVERMRIASDGRVFYGFTSSQSGGQWQHYTPANNYNIQFFSEYASGTGYFLEFIRSVSGSYNAVGTITASTTTTSYGTSSDYRLKDNVVLMSNSIDRLKQLKPSTWSWVQDGSHGEGFLAHEAQTVVPEAVTGTKDEVDDEGNPKYQNIDQSKLVPLLTAALQEAITKIETLETRIQTLENN